MEFFSCHPICIDIVWVVAKTIIVIRQNSKILTGINSHSMSEVGVSEGVRRTIKVTQYARFYEFLEVVLNFISQYITYCRGSAEKYYS